MTRICWWLVNVFSRMLAPDERAAVRGDIEESGESGVQALRDVLGLVARRQAGMWKSWRPWVALLGVALPLGVVLTLASRRAADGGAIYLWLYVNNWNPMFIETAVFRHDLLTFAVGMFLGYLNLACWSWTTGFTLGLLSRGATPANGISFFLVLVLTEILGRPPLFHSGRYFGANAVVFEVTFYRVIFTLIVQLVLVLLPAMWGMSKGIRLPLLAPGRRTVLRAFAIATVTAIGLLGLSWQRHALTQPVILDNSLRVFTYWPVVYLVVTAFEGIKHSRFKENHA
jgi:hypothetical protein